MRGLLGKGADINVEDKYGQSVLILAAKENYTDIVRTLLENGADINAKGIYGSTVLMELAFRGWWHRPDGCCAWV